MGNYLTPDDLEIAKQNGIPERLAKKRFYELGWEREKSITQPRGRLLWGKYKDICTETGISPNTFHRRVRSGMEPEIAAITPLTPRNERHKGKGS